METTLSDRVLHNIDGGIIKTTIINEHTNSIEFVCSLMIEYVAISASRYFRLYPDLPFHLSGKLQSLIIKVAKINETQTELSVSYTVQPPDAKNQINFDKNTIDMTTGVACLEWHNIIYWKAFSKIYHALVHYEHWLPIHLPIKECSVNIPFDELTAHLRYKYPERVLSGEQHLSSLDFIIMPVSNYSSVVQVNVQKRGNNCKISFKNVFGGIIVIGYKYNDELRELEELDHKCIMCNLYNCIEDEWPSAFEKSLQINAPVLQKEDKSNCRNIYPIYAHPLKTRRETVRRLKLDGGYTYKQIAKEISSTEDIVKADIVWLRENNYLAIK